MPPGKGSQVGMCISNYSIIVDLPQTQPEARLSSPLILQTVPRPLGGSWLLASASERKGILTKRLGQRIAQVHTHGHVELLHLLGPRGASVEMDQPPKRRVWDQPGVGPLAISLRMPREKDRMAMKSTLAG